VVTKTATKVPVKAPAKAPIKAPAKPVAPAKAAVKASAKVVKPPAKPAAKAPAKPAAKAPAKPAAKAAPAPVVKTVPKAPAKPAAKPAAKPPAAKPPVAKPVAAKPSAKALAKPPITVAPEPAAKPVAATVAKPVVAEPAPSAPTRKSKSRAASVPAPAPVVPTHSPDAAKASYVSATERLIAPPPAAAVTRKDPKLANNWKTKRPEELSDDEVKSMPDSEYMNEVQLAFFRLKLVKLKQDIHNSAGETTEHLREDTVVVPDPADRATIEEEHALELRTRDRERKLLKKIEQSIARIDAGDYGYCDETGEAIGVARLIARPTASLSLEAQQRRELKQKMFGD
jgi:DnaK suppressor protein